MLTVCIFGLFPGNAQTDGYMPGQLYVRLQQPSGPNNTYIPSEKVMSFFGRYREAYGITKVLGTFYFADDQQLRNTFRVYFAHPEKAGELIKALESNKAVVYAEKIPQDRFFFTPNDIGSNSNTGNGQWYLYKLRALQAWDIQRGKASVKVAVVDDAVQVDHPDLDGVCLPGRDVAENKASPTPPDSTFSHGTHVAGIIAAKTDNSFGIASLAHGVSIIPIKITLTGQPGTPTAGYEGILWAISQGADIINVSWGSEMVSYSAQSVIASAVAAGITVVAAAGNSNNATVNYPAGYPGVISVAGTNNVDKKHGSSSFGNWIDICAPGELIRSTIPFNIYGFKSGTSFAAPMVCAVAALMLSKDSTMTRAEIENCLKQSADNIDVFNPDFPGQLGAGRLNAEKALQCARAGISTCDLSLSSVQSPSTASCQNTFQPGIRILNNGLDTIFSFRLNYQLDNAFPKIYIFNDTLPPGKDTLLHLPQMQAAIGTHTLKFNIHPNINANCTDAFAQNSALNHPFTVLSPVSRVLPYNEDFESGYFTSNNWQIENPGSEFGWEIVKTAGLPSSTKSARLPYFIDSKIGERDYLTTPALNFSGYSAVNLSFKHAYITHGGPAPSDSFIISISTDCGETWSRLKTFVETGTKTFSTRKTDGYSFNPVIATDWCGASGWAACSNINLTAYKGLVGVRIRFEGYNANGNNIYLDNISITGTPVNIRPEANFTASGNEEICENQTVQFSNLSLNRPTSLKWYFEGGVPDSSDLEQPLITYPTAGTYAVRLIAENPAGKDTLLLDSLIRVSQAPAISVTAQPDSICKGQQSLLIASGGNAYSWSEHSSLSVTNNDSTIATPTATTNYTVYTLTPEGCSGSETVQVAVYPQPSQPQISTQGDSCTLESSLATTYEWYYNGSLLSGKTERTLQVNKPGNYNVRIADHNGCTAFSAPFKSLCSTTGIELMPPLLIRPNPTADFLLLEGLTQPARISLYNLSGALLIAPQQVNSSVHQLSLEGLANGIYLLQIIQAEHIQHVKVLKFNP